MTATLPLSRSLSKQLLARSTRSFTRPVPTISNYHSRVSCRCEANNDRSTHQKNHLKIGSILHQARSYATATDKPASRPKAHTGRAAAKPKRTATTSSKGKPAKKAAAKKPKVKKAVVKKPRVKKAPSKNALLKKARATKANLVTTALLDEPKKLPATAFFVIVAEQSKNGGGNVSAFSTAASNIYKSLSPEEREVRWRHSICPATWTNPSFP